MQAKHNGRSGAILSPNESFIARRPTPVNHHGMIKSKLNHQSERRNEKIWSPINRLYRTERRANRRTDAIIEAHYGRLVTRHYMIEFGDVDRVLLSPRFASKHFAAAADMRDISPARFSSYSAQLSAASRNVVLRENVLGNLEHHAGACSCLTRKQARQ